MSFKNKINYFLLSCLFLFFRTSFHSQPKFFISPEINFKTSTAFVDPNDLLTDENNLLENQGFYLPYAIAYNARVIKHQFQIFGLSAGLTYKNDSRFIKLSYNKDIAGFRAYSFYRPYLSPSFLGTSLDYQGIGYHRLMINYGLKITTKSKFVQSWFTIGAGININHNRATQIFQGHNNILLSANGDELLRAYIRTFEENRVNACLKIGFEHDLILNNKYIFSLNLQYIQGFGKISRIEYVHEYKLNGLFVYDGTGLLSRGSGLYWGINRRFQVYPWKKRAKKGV